MVRVREVATMGVGWESEEASDIVEPPLNLVLYMHLRIFAYTSNTLLASLEYMDWTLASGTLKTFFCVPECKRYRTCCPRVGGPLFRPVSSAKIFLSLLLPLRRPL
jgi:hypothetical protein